MGATSAQPTCQRAQEAAHAGLLRPPRHRGASTSHCEVKGWVGPGHQTALREHACCGQRRLGLEPLPEGLPQRRLPPASRAQKVS